MDTSKVKTKKYKLYKGDCLKILPKIKDKSIRLVLADLPYGTTNNKWDFHINLTLLWEQYKRIIKDNAAVLLFSQIPFSAVLGMSNLEMLKYEWIWMKTEATGFLNAKKAPLKKHENILVFYKNMPVYNPQFSKGTPYKKSACLFSSSNYGKYTPVEIVSDGKRYPTDILQYSREKNKVHPTQKPLKLLEYLIKTYSNENDIVLDNCMGSGSTGVACMNTHRRFIGIEKDEKYFNNSVKRIEKAFTTLSNFAWTDK